MVRENCRHFHVDGDDLYCSFRVGKRDEIIEGCETSRCDNCRNFKRRKPRIPKTQRRLF